MLLLSPEEARVLGCLIEKSRTTPDDYPLTANALMRACNQTTSRDPVVEYDQRTVDATAESLKAAGLVRFVHTPSGRATTRYRHVADEHLGLEAGATALLGMLLLRGAQTVNELLTRTERWHRFTGADEVVATLQSMAGGDEPLVVLLERQPGQKEARWTHVVYGEPLLPAASTSAARESVGPGARGGASTSDRIAALEAQVARLTAQLAEVRSELGMEVGDGADADAGGGSGDGSGDGVGG